MSLTTFLQMMSDSWFFQGFIKFLDKRFEQRQNNTFVYIFNYRGDIAFAEILGSGSEAFDYGISHGDDLLYMCPISNIFAPHMAPSEQDEQFRDVMIQIWIDFAVLGYIQIHIIC